MSWDLFDKYFTIMESVESGVFLSTLNNGRFESGLDLLRINSWKHEKSH